jgi:hypothetical protein
MPEVTPEGSRRASPIEAPVQPMSPITNDSAAKARDESVQCAFIEFFMECRRLVLNSCAVARRAGAILKKIH